MAATRPISSICLSPNGSSSLVFDHVLHCSGTHGFRDPGYVMIIDRSVHPETRDQKRFGSLQPPIVDNEPVFVKIHLINQAVIIHNSERNPCIMGIPYKIIHSIHINLAAKDLPYRGLAFDMFCKISGKLHISPIPPLFPLSQVFPLYHHACAACNCQ